jgi:hypothetical protein
MTAKRFRSARISRWNYLGQRENACSQTNCTHLKPLLQGHRLMDGDYQPIPVVHGRLPSQILGLDLERDGTELRLYNPATAARLPTREEALAAGNQQLALRNRQLALQDQQLALQNQQLTLQNQQLTLKDAENERLRRELEALRRTLPPAAGDPSGSCGTSS